MTCNTFYMIMLMKTWHELLCMSFFVPMSHNPTFSTYFWVNHFNYFSQLNSLIYETLLNWMKFLAKLSYFVILMMYHSLRIPITLKANNNDYWIFSDHIGEIYSRNKLNHDFIFIIQEKFNFKSCWCKQKH